MSAAAAAAMLRMGARLAERRAVAVAGAAAALAADLPGVRAEAEDGGVRLSGRGIRTRWLRGDAGLLGWIESTRAAVRGRL